jgi:hypothetical protein
MINGSPSASSNGVIPPPYPEAYKIYWTPVTLSVIIVVWSNKPLLDSISNLFLILLLKELQIYGLPALFSKTVTPPV